MGIDPGPPELEGHLSVRRGNIHALATISAADQHIPRNLQTA
jgi:hypothetical protein